MSQAVFGIASNEEQANRIIDDLREAGFTSDDISVLFPDKSSTKNFAHDKHTKAPEGAAAGVGTGAAVGGTLGWLAGIGLLAIPGLGPFIAAGPIMAALSGVAIGGSLGGLTGALIGMGIPELEAKRYEGRIRDGNILISVHSDDGDETARAAEILEHSGAADISISSESEVPRGRAAVDRQRR